jgi:asparagine synthase (glutamine-hydrolysing)
VCGIVGVARQHGRPTVLPAEIDQLCGSIRHRGPDDQGIHVDGRVGIGMRRLSIIDLTGGHQPIFNEDESKVVVFNGEIYNYRELRQHLLGRGHTLRTHSDTETIVHLYEEYGADCVKHLRGMFAFALWDRTTSTLLLARDRFGIKPLYIAERDGQIAFSSELKALIEGRYTDATLDWRAIEAFFSLGYIPAPYTPFEGVTKLEPGHVLIWRDGAMQKRRYWDVPTHTDARTPSADEVRGWIDESVASHLIADVPIAVLLSGGLDSSAVFSSMVAAGTQPHAFTARYHGSGAEGADETDLARALVNKYDARLTVVDVEPRVADLIEPIMFALDEPHADESAIPTWILSERVASEYKVALAGTGGDELFGGYRRHFGLQASEWYTNLPRGVRTMLRSAVSALPEPRSGGLFLHRAKRFLQTTPGSAAERYFDMLNKMSGIATKDLLAHGVTGRGAPAFAASHLQNVYRSGGAPRGVKAALYLDYKTYLPDDILHLSDRIAMAHSLEVRVPMVDHRLIERTFPHVNRLGNNPERAKPMLRSAIESRLTPAHFTAKKRGFVGPTAAWLRNELREMVTDELSPDRLGRLGFFNTDLVTSLVDDHMQRRHNRESVIWALLAFSVWHRVTVENRSRNIASLPTTVAL